MATARLVASTYYLSNSSYLSVSNASNMYTDTDSTTYAQITNSQTGTTSYYLYIRGFNFDAIPDGAIVNSFSIKLKARETGGSTSTSYSPKLCNGTTQLTSTMSALSTSTQTLTFSGYSLDWDTMVDYGSTFGIRINCRRASRNTTAYFYIYGAEIEVDYTIPVYHTLTVEDGGFNVDPTGTSSQMEDSTVTITVSEDSMPQAVLDGTNITSQFVKTALATSFSGAPSASSYSGLQSGTASVAYAVGYTAENPYSSSSNWYGSSSATVDSQYAQYTFDLSSIPSSAENIQVSCKVAGKAESTTYSHSSGGRYSVWQLCCNGTGKSEQIYTTSSSVTMLEFSDTGTWTREELDGLQLRHFVGYYGGTTNGATLTITYSLSGGSEVYVYQLAIGTSDHTLVFSALSSGIKIFYNGGWQTVQRVYQYTENGWQTSGASELQGLYSAKTYVLY